MDGISYRICLDKNLCPLKVHLMQGSCECRESGFDVNRAASLQACEVLPPGFCHVPGGL